MSSNFRFLSHIMKFYSVAHIYPKRYNNKFNAEI